MTASAAPLATWAGTHIFTAPRLIEATSVEQVQDAVRTRSGRVRALGTRHSFNDLADTDGTLISLTAIDPRPVLDESARTVTVGGGTRYGVLAAWLEERGWVQAEWRVTEHKRRAKVYTLTPRGRQQLGAETDSWHQFVAAVASVLGATHQPA